MYAKSALFGLFVLVIPHAAQAETLTVSAWIDQFIDMCVGAGSTSVTSGSGDANAGITLKSFSLGGELKGQISLNRQQFRLLSEGISNKMSDVAAGQADKVRDCLEPVRRQMLAVMSAQLGTSTSPQSTVQILSPDEDKLIRALANTPGTAGAVGQLVPLSAIRQKTGLGEIRSNAAFRSLAHKQLAGAVPSLGSFESVASLWPAGEEYALAMNYAN